EYEKILKDIEKPEMRQKMKQKTEKLEFSDISDIKETLKDYISESGKYINIVKSVSININYEPIRYIDIVDTPGLNDPIVSRSQKTKKFIDTCDILFLLSSSSQFLEKADIELLAEIYRRRSAKIYVIASKFDLVLCDALVGMKNKDIDFKELFEIELEKRKGEFKSHLQEYEKLITQGIIDENVLYFSSAFYKKLNNVPLSNDEKKAIDKLSQKTKNFDVDSYITGFEQIKAIIDKYKDEKFANATKSEIVRKYLEERPKSIKKLIDLFIENITETLNKKGKNIKEEIKNLENERQIFQKNKQEIKNKLEDTYGKYLKELSDKIDKTCEKFSNRVRLGLNLQKIKEEVEKIGYETRYERIEKSGFFSAIARAFDCGGYEEVPVKYEYKYYDRDLLIKIIEDLIKDVNREINVDVKRTFNLENLKRDLADVLREYDLKNEILDKALSLSVKIPNIKISEDAVPIYHYLMNKYKEITDENVLKKVSESAEDFIKLIKEKLNKLKQEVEEQIIEQVRNIIKEIESEFDDQMKRLLNIKNKSKEDLEKFFSNCRELKDDLSDLKGVIKYEYE
ncbi:MAG: dynamin family protein, partial [Candidatus Hydrothermia bacterium]